MNLESDMLAFTKYPTEMLRNIVTDAQTALNIGVAPADQITLHYEHGHPLEVINTIQEMTRTPKASVKKFPLVMLFQDFDELHDNARTYTVSFHLVIAVMTRPEYKAAKRMTVTFIPKLYPIYDALMQSIARSGYFMEVEEAAIPHKKTDRMYWGKQGLYGNTKSMFNDYIDAIEITDLKLTVKIKNC